MVKYHIIWSLVSCFIAWLLFSFYPHLDITIAEYFYDPTTQNFIGNTSNNILWFLHRFAKLFPIYFSIVVILFLLGSLFITKFRIKWRKETLFVAMCLWIGPGLIVNSIFKDHWGRPRPVMVQEFSGNKVFQKPFVVSNQCRKNCSFVCGDASIGFWNFAFMPILPTRKKKFLAFTLAIFTGASFGLMRVAQGGHFFSDVVFCGVFMYICTWMVYWVMYEREKK